MKIILLLITALNFIYASIGSIVSLSGNATIKRHDITIKANLYDRIIKGDVIVTSNKTLLKIVLYDKTKITLGENSALDISDYLYDEKQKDKNSVSLNFFKGSFKSITGRIGKLNPKKFKLKTKNASIGIRGTTVVGNQEKIACTSGLISVTSGGVTLMVKAGQMTKVSANKAPTKPTKYNPKEFKTITSGEAKGTASTKDTPVSLDPEAKGDLELKTVVEETNIDKDTQTTSADDLRDADPQSDPDLQDPQDPQSDPDPQDPQDPQSDPDPQDPQDPQSDPDPQDPQDPQSDPDPQDPQDPQSDPDPQDPQDPQSDPISMSDTSIYNGFVSGIKNSNGNIIVDKNSDSSDVKIEFTTDKTEVKADIQTDDRYSYKSEYENTNSVTDDYTFSMSNEGDHVDTLGHNDYTTWGRWSGSKFFFSSRLDSGYFIAGQLTNNDDLPTTGIVRYQGDILGTVYDNGYKDLDGTSNIVANFSTNTLTGTLNINYKDDGMLFSNAQIDNGTISADVNCFSGDLKDGTADGTINGAFFGPQAVEIGGNWTIEKDGNKASGIFNGESVQP